MIKMGSYNLTEALNVGALIEEVDILDLEEAISFSTQIDVLKMYNN